MAKKGKKSLAETHPEIAKQADGWDPTERHFDKEILSWSCPEGHKYSTKLKDRKAGSGCHFCSGFLVISGENDIQTRNPELAKELLNDDPSLVSIGSSKKLLWGCQKGHSWVATPRDRNNDMTGCPFCSDRRLLSGFNDLETRFPSLADEIFSLEPSQVLWNTKRLVHWKCAKGHIWIAAVFSRTKLETGCPYCTNRRVLIGFNDLRTTHPKLFLELEDRDSLLVTAGSTRYAAWICEKGHRWRARVAHRALSDSGCPTCSPGGFDPNAEGWLYFLKHFEWGMFQIGITNHPKRRIRTHFKLGWELIELRGPMDGHLVQQWEIAILRHIRSNGGKLADKIGIEPFDGYSESWLKESFSFSSLKEIMDVVDQQED